MTSQYRLRSTRRRIWVAVLGTFLSVAAAAPAYAESAESFESSATLEIESGITVAAGKQSPVQARFDGTGTPFVPGDRQFVSGTLGQNKLVMLGAETCYWAKPDINIPGEHNSWYYIEWCGKDGKVTKVLTLTCGGSNYYAWEYQRCSVSRGALGYSNVRVLGSWDYRAGCCGAYVYRDHSVDARHYHNGAYTGTWYAS